MIERRKHERYHVKTGTFALLRSTSIEFSKIREMGMGEIGFAVIKSKANYKYQYERFGI
jgi:hypothetical protein